jgi:hypothetical protein
VHENKQFSDIHSYVCYVDSEVINPWSFYGSK